MQRAGGQRHPAIGEVRATALTPRRRETSFAASPRAARTFKPIFSEPAIVEIGYDNCGRRRRDAPRSVGVFPCLRLPTCGRPGTSADTRSLSHVQLRRRPACLSPIGRTLRFAITVEGPHGSSTVQITKPYGRTLALSAVGKSSGTFWVTLPLAAHSAPRWTGTMNATLASSLAVWPRAWLNTRPLP